MARELAYRSADSVEVVLLWERGSRDLTVRVRDARSGDEFELAVDPAQALDAFHHPYAYAARRGVPYAAGVAA